jgi:hypothetical protein
MINRILLFVLLLCQTAAFAQFKTIAEGPVFDESEDGYARIIQMKNGNTVFITMNENGGINAQVYDKAHKQKADKRLEPAYGKLKDWAVEGCFEINSDVLLFVRKSEKKGLLLYRLIIDGKTGALKKEETIWDAPETSVYKAYKKADFIGAPAFTINKAINSEHYSITLVNGFTTEENKRVEIAIYDASHRETGRSFYRSGNDKDIKYLDIDFLSSMKAAMIDSTTVCLLVNIANFAGKKEKEDDLGLACLKGGDVTIRRLSYTRDLDAKAGLIKYNPVSGKLMALGYGYDWREKRGDPYTSVVTIDLATLKEDKGTNVQPLKLEEASKGIFDKHSNFNYKNTPQDIVIHDDGSYAILFQGLIRKDRPSGAYEYCNSDIGVNNYDVNGKALKSYLISQEHLMFKLEPAAFDHYKLNRNGLFMGRGDQYKYFSYLYTKTGKQYVLINDVEENERLAKKGKQTIVQGIRNCDAFYFDINSDQVMPARNFVFDKDAKAGDHRPLMNTVADYDSEHNIYATLKLNPGKQSLQLVWLEL